MVTDKDYINAWDKRVGPTTAHLEYNDTLKKEDLEKLFKQATKGVDLLGAMVIDYGCGGGFLCEYLLNNKDIGGYVGLDISERSIAAAKKRFKNASDIVTFNLISPMHKCEKETPFDELYQTFCLNVLQHMPDSEHLDNILEVLDSICSENLILNFRQGEKLEFSPTPYKTTHEINLANKIPLKYITSKLKNYKLKRSVGKKTDEFKLAVYERCL